MINKWITEDDKLIENYKIFNLHKVIRVTEDLKKKGEFVYLDSPDWVNIIPVTKNNKIILIEQYRQGINEITLEIPGGMVEKLEEPKTAGMRECTEETGFYSSNEPELLGIIRPNPAFLTNRCYSYLWPNVEKLYEQHLDGNEEITLFEASFDEVKNLIKSGRINHSLVLNAFFLYFMKNQ